MNLSVSDVRIEEFIEEVEIETEEEGTIKGTFIAFECVINDRMYIIELYKTKKHWYPQYTFHADNLKTCPFCERKMEGQLCSRLELWMDKIIEIIEKHPNVRLKLLFLKR